MANWLVEKMRNNYSDDDIVEQFLFTGSEDEVKEFVRNKNEEIVNEKIKNRCDKIKFYRRQMENYDPMQFSNDEILSKKELNDDLHQYMEGESLACQNEINILEHELKCYKSNDRSYVIGDYYWTYKGLYRILTWKTG